MKKILLIHHTSKTGGGTKSLIDLYHMLKKNYNVKVIIPHGGSDGINHYFDLNDLFIVKNVGSVNIYSGGPRVYQLSFWNGLKNILSSREKITNIVQEFNPDILIVNSVVISWIGYYLRRLKISKMCIVRETSPGRIRITPFKIFLRYFSKVIYISEFDQNSYKLKELDDSYILRDSYVPINGPVFLPNASFPKNKTNVLFLGGGNPLKGWNTVKKAIKELCNIPSIHFNIAGFIEDSDKIIQDNVTYVGLVSNTLELYKNTDILIFPSSKAHQSRPVFEAGFHSIPVIISNFKQNQEQVHHGINGITIKPNSADDLINAITYLANNAEIRVYMGTNNFSYYHKLNNYDNNMKLLNEIIERELCGKHE